MIDQELLKACVINFWSIVPRMMLVDSMIENGYFEFKALEAFEPPTVSNNLPLTYYASINNGGRGSGISIGGGNGSGSGISIGRGGSGSDGHGSGNGDGDGNGLGSYDDNCGFLMIAKQQWLTKNY